VPLAASTNAGAAPDLQQGGGMDSLKKFIYKKYLATTNNILKNIQEVEATEFYSHEQVKDYQKSRLFDVLNYASQMVPYYKKVFPRLNSLEEFDYDYFRKIPLLDKELIKRNFSQLSSDDLNKRKYYFNTSGGSTGTPAKFIQDSYYFEYKQAMKLFFNKWCGCPIGDRQMVIWGSTRDLFSGKNSPKTCFGRWIRNEIWLNAFHVAPEDMQKFVNRMNSFRPKLILAYVDTIYDLASFIEKKGMEVYPPGSIMVTAGTLTPEMREKITKVFKTGVFNRYGSREVGDIACECDHHMGLHVAPTALYVEILDSDGEEVAPGQVGEIVVTSLTNYSMPLIRYKIGDLGSWATKPCTCGRNWPLIEQVTGRVCDIFVRKDGIELHSGIFSQLLYFKDWIKKFQIIQEDYEEIKIRVVLEDANVPQQQDFDVITKNIKEVMGQGCNVEYEIVQDIPKTDSGKYRYRISKVKNRYS
jgi:phenylacetate-CoA ligase